MNKPSEKISLEQLYQQRKAQHTLPESIKKQLTEQTTKQKRPARFNWTIALPIAFASVMTVIIIYPAQEQREIMQASQFSASDSMLSDSLISQEEMVIEAPFSETETPASIANLASDSQGVTEFTAQQKQASSAMKSSVQSEQMAPSAPAADALAEADVYRVSRTIIASDSPLRLEVVNGKQGEFKQCDGEHIQLDITTELTGWVIATFQDERWELASTEGNEKPCDTDSN